MNSHSGRHKTGCAVAALLLSACCAGASDFVPPEKSSALDALKPHIAEALKSGRKIEVWLTVFGSLQKLELLKADSTSLTVKTSASPLVQNWDKISPEQIAGVAKNCVQDVGQRALALADYCLATQQTKKAEEALALASAGPALAEEIAMRTRYLASLSGKNNSSEPAMGLSAVRDPVALSAPARIAFKPSESGALMAVKDVAAAIDNIIEINLAEMGIKPEMLCDDAAFLRRVSLDLNGQIPTPEEVIEFYRDNASTKRASKIAELLERDAYAEHWATFWNVLLVGRRTRDDAEVKVAPLKNWLRDEFSANRPFDKIVTELLTATGENDKVGPVNYLTLHLNDNLPNTVAHLSQTFLGARIGCAQCHDHPFDKWSQADFWGFSSFLADTLSERRELKEDPKDPTRVTKSWHVLTDQNQRNGGGRYDPPQANLRLPPKPLDGPVFLASSIKKAEKKLETPLTPPPPAKSDKLPAVKTTMSGDAGKMTGGKMAMDKPAEGMMNTGMMGGTIAAGGGEMGQIYRTGLANWITDPSNEKFSQSAVNRVWRAMFGYGLVEPVDDIRPKNAPSHPEAMNLLAQDFNASGRDWKRLCSVIAHTKAYQRSSIGTLQKVDRHKSVRYAARAEVRPMTPEMLFTAIIKSTGGEEKSQALLTGLKVRDQAMMSGAMQGVRPEVNQFYELMQRFINTSTAEDRAGKLQFEGTVAQALMMMHSDFMNQSIKNGVTRFTKKGQGDMVYLFAATLGRPPTPPEANVFAKFSSGKEGLEGIMWILLNSAEFVTIH